MPRPSSALSASDIKPEELPLTHECRIPESYRDDMGHMNVVWYTRLFIEASLELLRNIGMDFKELLADGAGSFILESHIRHLAEIRIGKQIRIHSRVLSFSDSRVHFMHFLVIEEDQVLAATGEFVHAYIDMSVRRMAPFPEEIRTTIEEACEEHGRLAWDPPICGVMGAKS